MLKTRIIPCLDVADGRVVKGVNFVDLVDAGDPVESARAYDAAGADELCFLDIHATHENRGVMMDVVTRTLFTSSLSASEISELGAHRLFVFRRDLWRRSLRRTARAGCRS